MAAKWVPLKIVSRRVKEVILRTIGQMIKCQRLNDIKTILLSLFIVITNETDGLNKNTGLETPCEMHKKKLVNYSSSGKSKLISTYLNNIRCLGTCFFRSVIFYYFKLKTTFYHYFYILKLNVCEK